MNTHVFIHVEESMGVCLCVCMCVCVCVCVCVFLCYVSLSSLVYLLACM